MRGLPVAIGAALVLALALLTVSSQSKHLDISLAQATQPAQPSIVLILTDDQRWDELVNMPTVQSGLVAKGVTFTNGFVVNPLCCPSRASILTGKYSHGTDVYSNIPPHGGFRTFKDISTIATWLHAAGYATGFVGKYLNGYTPLRSAYVPPGWDSWDALTFAGGANVTPPYYNYDMSIDGTQVHYGSTDADYTTDVFDGYAMHFLNSVPIDQPLFLMFAPNAPHPPATPPARYASAFPDLQPLRPPNYNEADVSDKPSYIQAAPLLGATRRAKQDALRLHQFQALLAVDDAVNDILAVLRNTGRLSNTLIFFLSDNGLEIGEHRWVGKKVPYEESIRVPVIVRYDAMTNQIGATNGDFVLNIDVAPTLADAAGVPAPGAEGTSLLPLLDGSAASWRSDFLIEHADSKTVTVPTYCAVRDQRYKYVKYQTGEEELYDLQADPYELVNVAIDPGFADVKTSMHDQMVALCVPPPPGFTP